jgi:hypothetical protein
LARSTGSYVVWQLLIRVPNHGDEFAHRHGDSLLGDDFAQNAAGIGFKLNRGFVGLYVGYYLAPGNLLSLAFVPLHYGAFPHVVAHLGHHNVSRQTSLPMLPVKLPGAFALAHLKYHTLQEIKPMPEYNT